ncbi:hypothetical protein FACS1894130_09660 [Spirochaetia bacterium]|nr:hypothetical protein FACS1894130_09660 [Spirochaetia bacterium]
MKKVTFGFVVLLTLLLGTTVFSQEKKTASIIGNLIIGGSSIMSDGYDVGFVSTGFDVDLISTKGVQLTFGYLVNINFEYGIYQNLYLGAGYHFVRDTYHVGGSLVILPDGNVDVLIGSKAEGGYFFTGNLGISAIMLFAHGVMNEYMIFSGGLGLTIRL